MDFDWKTLLRTVAPGIASVFGTPLAGMGVTALLNVLLPPDAQKPTGDDAEVFIKQALAGVSPDTLLKIKEAEQQFHIDLKRLDIDLEKFLAQLDAQDTADARSLKRSWLSSDKFDYEPILAAFVAGSFLYAEWWVFEYAMAVVAMDPNKAMLIGRILGTVDAAFMLLLSFRWGTSRSSERKTEIAAAQAQAQLEQPKI